MKDKKIEQMKESSAMRKKRIAKNLFLAVCSMFLAGSVTGIAVACDEGTPPPVIITEGQETGVYYFADGEQEYMLTLNSGNLFTIVGGNANRSGSYTIADGALTFSFIKMSIGGHEPDRIEDAYILLVVCLANEYTIKRQSLIELAL